MEYKKEYEPFWASMKSLKKARDINGLCLPPPMGNMPLGVKKEIATEFVKTFIVGVKKAIMKRDKKKKVGMKKIKAFVRDLREKAGIGGEDVASKEGKTTERVRSDGSGAARPKDVQEKNEKNKTTTTAAAKKTVVGKYGKLGDKLLADNIKEKAVKELVEHIDGAFRMFGQGKDGTSFSHKDIATIYKHFGTEMTPEDIEYVIELLTNGKSSTLVTHDAFCDSVYENIGRKEVYGDLWDMIVKGDEMTLSELRSMLKTIGEEEKNEHTLRSMLRKMSTRDDFVKYWGDMLIDVVHPKAPPKIVNANASGASSTSGSTTSGNATTPKRVNVTSEKSAVAILSAGKDMKSDPKYAKYFKIIKFHLPVAAALRKAQEDGITGNELKKLESALR